MQKKIISCVSTTSLVVLIFLSGCFDVDSPSGPVVIDGKGSYTSIQNAINASSDGDTIFVYAGVYNETFTINKSINLIGAGRNKSIIEYAGNISNINIISIYADNCIIDGFTLTVSSSSNDIVCIKTYSSNTTISNNVILNASYGIFLARDSKGSIVSYNIISNNQNGIYSTYSSDNNISCNNVSLNSEYGIYAYSGSDDNVLSGNMILNNKYGLRLKSSRNNVVYKNKIYNNDRKGVYICCGSKNNHFYKNVLIKNNPNAYDPYSNHWDNGSIGNYWDDYAGIDANHDGIGDTPYVVYAGEDNKDNFPLVDPINITIDFSS